MAPLVPGYGLLLGGNAHSVGPHAEWPHKGDVPTTTTKTAPSLIKALLMKVP